MSWLWYHSSYLWYQTWYYLWYDPGVWSSIVTLRSCPSLQNHRTQWQSFALKHFICTTRWKMSRSQGLIPAHAAVFRQIRGYCCINLLVWSRSHLFFESFWVSRTVSCEVASGYCVAPDDRQKFLRWKHQLSHWYFQARHCCSNFSLFLFVLIVWRTLKGVGV